MQKRYRGPRIKTEFCFESTALACGKTPVPPSGSHHFVNGYDTFTGHFGPGMGAEESVSSQVGIGFGIATTTSYWYSGLCMNWVTLAS